MKDLIKQSMPELDDEQAASVEQMLASEMTRQGLQATPEQLSIVIPKIAQQVRAESNGGQQSQPQAQPPAAPAAPAWNAQKEYGQADDRYQEALAKIESRRKSSNVGQALLSRWNPNRVDQNNKRFDDEAARAKDATIGTFDRMNKAQQDQSNNEWNAKVRGRQETEWGKADRIEAEENDPNSDLSKSARDILIKGGYNIPENASYATIVKQHPFIKEMAAAAYQKARAEKEDQYRAQRLGMQAEGLEIQRQGAQNKVDSAKNVGFRKAAEEYGKDLGEGKIDQVINTSSEDIADLKEIERLAASGEFDPSGLSALANAYAQAKDNPGLVDQVLKRYATSPGIQTANAIFSKLAPRQRVAGSGSSSNLDIMMFFNGLGAGISDPKAFLARVSKFRQDEEAKLANNKHKRDYFNEHGELPRSQAAPQEGGSAPTSSPQGRKVTLKDGRKVILDDKNKVIGTW